MNPIRFVRDHVASVTGTLVGALMGPAPSPARPAEAVTRSDAPPDPDDGGCDECEGEDGFIDPPAEPHRTPVTFHVDHRRVTAEMRQLTPDDIVRAAGYEPRDGLVLVRRTEHTNTVVGVYGPTESNTPIDVRRAKFEVWDSFDERLHWHMVGTRRYAGLDFAAAPAAVLRRAGYDPDRYQLCEVAGGERQPIEQDDRRPVRVSGRDFVAVARD